MPRWLGKAVVLIMLTGMSGERPVAESAPTVVRQDFHVPGEAAITLFVREVAPAGATRGTVPVVLVHGARVPGLGSFDLPVAGGSLAVELAEAGHRTYVMDARGYGGSTRSPEMTDPPAAHPPLVRAPEVARDIGAVVDWVLARTGSDRVALLGWATGGHWAGYYATVSGGRLSHLIVYNSLYGGSAEHAAIGRGSSLEDATRPGRPNLAGLGAYRLSTGPSLLEGWDQSIPLADKAEWRDPAVAAAYVRAALASDPTSGSRNPPSFRAPSGALEESFYQATGRQLWDASLIRVPTLVVASERDFWSRRADRGLLADHLIHAPMVRAVEIADATHWVHLDRPERGRARFVAEVLDFLRTDAAAR